MVCRCLFIQCHCQLKCFQGPRFSAANFAKFRSTVCEIPRNLVPLLSPNTLHSAASRRCCIKNTSKYKEFIITCNRKTHYIGPLVITISSHITHNYHKSKLTTVCFCCYVNGKIKKELEKIELDINVAKNGQFHVFPQQAANSAANNDSMNSVARRKKTRSMEYCWPWL